MNKGWGWMLLPLCLAIAGPAEAESVVGRDAATEQAEAAGRKLLDLPLEELMRIRVTSAAKKDQAIDDVAAAVYVLTGEDLRRSGAMCLPEALRLVPGIHVARIDANKWAISARGFNDRFANKMLVLVDGRSIYTRLFSGVYWEMLDIPFELIDRIEVVRGPGATVWGANAVNGVINIITKKVSATPGRLLGLGTGTSEPARVTGIASWQLGERAGLRVHGFYADRAAGYTSGREVDDSWTTGHLGLRLDWQRSPREELTAHGELGRQLVSSESHLPLLSPPYTQTHRSADPLQDHSLLLRWTRRYRESDELTVQSYLQGNSLDVDKYLAHRSRTVDLEVVNRMRLSSAQEFMAGIEVQRTWDHVDSTEIASLDPLEATTTLTSGFVQHESRPWGDKLIGTVGSKFEHHPLTGWEAQPNLRVLWNPAAGHAVWGAVSRAVREPSRVDESLRYRILVVPPDPSSPGAPATLVTVEGNDRFRAEETRALDGGYRLALTRRLKFELNGFLYSHRDLRSTEMGAPRITVIDGTTFVLVPTYLANLGRERSYGCEAQLQWSRARALALTGVYGYLRREELRTNGTSEVDALLHQREPEHVLTLRGEWNPSPRVEADVAWRYVSEMPTPKAPAYLTADLRLGYRWSQRIRTDLLARNLLAGRHREYSPPFALTTPTAVEPSFGLWVELRP